MTSYRAGESYRGGGDSYRGGAVDSYRGGGDSYRGGADSYRGGESYRYGGDSYRGGQESGGRGGNEIHRESYRGDFRESRGREEAREGGGYRGGSGGAPRYQPPPGDNRRIYVGNLPDQVEKQDLYEYFEKYGVVRDVQLKYGRTQNGTAYAFVEFERPTEAEEAQIDTDDQPFMGTRLRVELTGIRKRRKPAGYSGPPIRSDHRVVVTGLPQHCSWQDLKDFMRQAGPVGFASVEGDRGIVEYETPEGKAAALRDLHKSEFRNPFGRATIRVYEEDTYDYRGGQSRDSYGAAAGAGGRRYSNGSGDVRKRYRSASPGGGDTHEREAPPHEKMRRYSDGRGGAPPPEDREASNGGRYSPSRNGGSGSGQRGVVVSPPRSRSLQPSAGAQGGYEERGGGRSRSRSPSPSHGAGNAAGASPRRAGSPGRQHRSDWDDREAN